MKFLLKIIQKNNKDLNTDLANKTGYQFWRRSAGYMKYLTIVKGFASRYAHGDIIDIGAGTGVYRRVFAPYGSYRSLDTDFSDNAFDIEGTFEKIPVPNDSIQTLVSFQVLQYVPNLEKAAEEAYRVLERGGHLILGVPHLSYLNNEPYDYWRFTDHSIKYLFGKAGFSIVEEKTAGSIFSFLGWIWSTTLLGLTYHIPVVYQIAWYVNLLSQYICRGIDTCLPIDRIMPLSYIFVLRKI